MNIKKTVTVVVERILFTSNKANGCIGRFKIGIPNALRFYRIVSRSAELRYIARR